MVRARSGGRPFASGIGPIRPAPQSRPSHPAPIPGGGPRCHRRTRPRTRPLIRVRSPVSSLQPVAPTRVVERRPSVRPAFAVDEAHVQLRLERPGDLVARARSPDPNSDVPSLVLLDSVAVRDADQCRHLDLVELAPACPCGRRRARQCGRTRRVRPASGSEPRWLRGCSETGRSSARAWCPSLGGRLRRTLTAWRSRPRRPRC